MRLYSLGGRLSAVADFIPTGARIADIGTDHCRLPIWLVTTGRIERAIATDIRTQPLERAAVNCSRWDMGGRVELRLSDGLEAVAPGECSHIVISGMGGETIAAILSRAPWTADGEHRLILQAETSARELRRFLYRSGYTVIDEKAVIDGGRVYSVMLVSGAAAPEQNEPFYEYISLPLSRQHDAAGFRYVGRVRRAVEDELHGLERSSAEYAEKPAVCRRLCEMEDSYGESK